MDTTPAHCSEVHYVNTVSTGRLRILGNFRVDYVLERDSFT